MTLPTTVDDGVVMDSHIAISDHPETPNAPFDEFPRLAAMADDELSVVVAVGLRFMALHNSRLPVTMFDLPDEPPNGIYDLIAEIRRRTTSIAHLRPIEAAEAAEPEEAAESKAEWSGAETVVLRLTDDADVALIASSISAGQREHDGLIQVRIGSADEARAQANGLTERHGVVGITVWSSGDATSGDKSWGDARQVVVAAGSNAQEQIDELLI